MRRRLAAALLAALLPSLVLALASSLVPSPVVAESNLAVTGDVVARDTLRVCSDPDNLPFSNDKGEGFENAVAELMADHLGRRLTYTWYPQTIGFIRQTLRNRLCDLIIGVVSADELTQNTNPYYHSTYVMVRRSADADKYASLESPLLRTARIGIVAGTPPGDLLARQGLLASVRPYQLMVDTRREKPLRDMVEDLVQGRIDVAIGWGPAIGYFAKEKGDELSLVALQSNVPGLRMDYRISMGIRPNEPVWKHTINDAIKALQPEINKTLVSFGVPLVDDQGRLMGAAGTTPPASDVEEPLGYRMEEYRAPVPATIEGGTAIDANALAALLASATPPVMIDVLPKQRRPKNRDPAKPWFEAPRMSIEGATWLPNVGYGELSAEFATYLEQHLAQLTAGDKSRPVVFFCDANCWMSWNAAKRAIEELGYTKVYWLPSGVQGWKAAGHTLVQLTEEPMPDFLQ